MRPARLLAIACAWPLAGLTADEPDAALVRQMQRCAAIAGSADRLTCFDEVARGIVPPEQLAQRSKEEFGLPSAPQPTGNLVSMIEAKVVAFGRSRDARPTVRLDNGQVWELDAEDLSLQVNHTVTIRRGALSSFLLTTERKRVHRVRRLK